MPSHHLNVDYPLERMVEILLCKSPVKLQECATRLLCFEISPILLKRDQTNMKAYCFHRIFFIKWSQSTEIFKKKRPGIFHVENKDWQGVWNVANQDTHFCSFTIKLRVLPSMRLYYTYGALDLVGTFQWPKCATSYLCCDVWKSQLLFYFLKSNKPTL